MGFGRRGMIERRAAFDADKLAAESEDQGPLGTYLAPEPTRPLGQGNARNMGQAPPSMGGKSGGGQGPRPLPQTPQQSLNRAGPDFSSGGNPFAKFAQRAGVQRNNAPTGKSGE